MAWQTPKTDWSAADGVRDTDMNRIEGNLLELFNIESLQSSVTVYVTTAGNDTTGNGTSAAPYRTITKALSVIPKNLNGFSATVNVATGTYSERVDVTGYHGGNLSLNATGSISLIGLYVRDSSIEISGAAVNIGASGIYAQYRSHVLFANTSPVILTGGNVPIYISDNSTLILDKLTVNITSASASAVYAFDCSNIYIRELVGSTNQSNVSFLRAAGGASICYGSLGTVTGFAVTHATESGGRIYTGAQASVPNY